MEHLRAAQFPIGWAELPKGFRGWLLAILGWLVTAFAVSLGSNFWFDMLAKTLQIRGGGAKVSASIGRVVSGARSD